MNTGGGLIFSQAYLQIQCGDVSLSSQDGEGGFIMSELDIIVNTFATGPGNEDQVYDILLHELGHAHMLQHAFCSPGANCTVPLMHPNGNDGMITSYDATGANRVYGTSVLIANAEAGCSVNGQAVTVLPIDQGDCGGINNIPIDQQIGSLLVYPNPTVGGLTIESGSINLISYSLYFNGTAIHTQHLERNGGSHHIDLSNYPAGTYFLRVQTEKGLSINKIVKL